MAIQKDNKRSTTIYYVINGYNYVVSSVYKGAILLWSAIKSCFGAGYWQNSAPWDNNESYKN